MPVEPITKIVAETAPQSPELELEFIGRKPIPIKPLPAMSGVPFTRIVAETAPQLPELDLEFVGKPTPIRLLPGLLEDEDDSSQ